MTVPVERNSTACFVALLQTLAPLCVSQRLLLNVRAKQVRAPFTSYPEVSAQMEELLVQSVNVVPCEKLPL